MPIYEYQCQYCGHQLEEMQKVSEAAITHCPNCSKDGLTKMISASQIQFQGSGWYVNDYSTKKKNTTGEKSESAKDVTTKPETPATTSKPQDGTNDK